MMGELFPAVLVTSASRTISSTRPYVRQRCDVDYAPVTTVVARFHVAEKIVETIYLRRGSRFFGTPFGVRLRRQAQAEPGTIR